MWNNLTDGTNATDGREDLLTCTNGNGINTDNNSYANRVHVAGETMKQILLAHALQLQE